MRGGAHSELARAAGRGLAAGAWALRVGGGGPVCPAWAAALTWERTVRRVCPRAVTEPGWGRSAQGGLYRGLQSIEGSPALGSGGDAEPGGMRVLLLRGVASHRG